MVAHPSSTMAASSIILAVFLLLGQGSASIQDHCTDISYWDEMRYETTTKQCCDTKLHQVCTTKSDQICQDVLELQCEVVAWGECQSTPTSTLSTKCGVKYNDFAHQNCEEVTTSVKHTKKVPECKEITKNNCVTDWDLDSNGNKVWAGTETCTPVTWEECDIVEKTVEFPTVKTECDVNSHIKWTELVDVTTNIVGLESKCEVKKAVNCKHVEANKCTPVVWDECKMEPREECRAVVIHTPIQEKIHQKKCLTGDNTAHLNQTRPRNQLLQNDSFPLDLATLLKPTRGQAPATEMHNIGKIFSGYDIMKGNPLPVGIQDPGFRQPIFKASYQSGSITADRRYLQPDGTTISSCIGTCSLSFGTTEISGSKSYQDSLARKVGLSVGGSSGVWAGKFSASVGYKEVAEKTSSGSNLFTLSSASCCAYSAELLSFKLPSLSQNFRSGVETLTEKYDETIYLGFINAFGTHFIGQARMGALYGQQSEISKEAWTNMQENGIDIGTGAELSAYGVTASADFSNSVNGKKAKAFSSKTEDQKTFTIGVKPPADGKTGTWLQKTISDPAPIELTLGGSLLDLFDHDDIKSKVNTSVKANMKRALDEYCSLLLKSGKAKTCSSPGADPAFPSRIAEPELSGYCLTSGGHDQNSGTQSLNAGDKDSCYHQCKAVPQATGCEWHKNGVCIYHTLDVATGNGNSDYKCWVFNSSPTGVKSIVFPDPEKYYVIENDAYPGSRIQGNAAKELGECTTQLHGTTSQNWRFEPVGQAYYIYNQEARYHRLCSAKWANNDFCLYAGRLYDDQKWRLTRIGGNKVRITNVANNFKLGQWAPGECGTGDWGQYDDQIWELKEVK